MTIVAGRIHFGAARGHFVHAPHTGVYTRFPPSSRSGESGDVGARACYDSLSMDLLDDPSRPPSPEPSMRRFRKVLIVLAACGLALVLSLRHRGEGMHIEANAPLRAAVRSPTAAYDLSQLPVFTKAQYYVK